MKFFLSIILGLLTSVMLVSSATINVSLAASGYKLLADIPTITPTGVDSAGKPAITLVDYMKGVFIATIGLAIVLAVVQLVIGGIEYVAAAVPSAKEDAKRRIGGAVGGLLLILAAWLILDALNPKLLNVGLNLEKVGTVTGGDGGAAGGGAGGGGGDLCSPGSDPGRYSAGKCAPYFAMIDGSPMPHKSLTKSIMVMESGCSPDAVSTAGACGIMQMKPSTAAGYSSSCGGPATPDCAYLKANPEKSICMGAKYLNNSVSVLGMHNGMASYNAGLGDGAMGGSVHCAPDNPLPPTASCAGGVVRKWECPYSNVEHTSSDTGFAETRTYVRGVRYYLTKF